MGVGLGVGRLRYLAALGVIRGMER